VSFDDNHNLLIVAASLAIGLLPTYNPHFYDKFPKDFQTIFGSSITSTVIVVFVLNLVFNHWFRGGQGHSVETALESGAVSASPEEVSSALGDGEQEPQETPAGRVGADPARPSTSP
jgi:NCS2 family nucleobase:cation symporter-2